MNALNKASITINNKNIPFKNIVSVVKLTKTLIITDIDGQKYDIADQKMIDKFIELVNSKANFVYFENRHINTDLVEDVKQITKPANKEFSVVVNFAGTKEIFNFESAPAADEMKKKITKVIKPTKDLGITR